MSNNDNAKPNIVGLASFIPEVNASPKPTIEPLFDRMLVRTLASGDRTKGGLYIPDSALDGTPWKRGEIVAQGKGHITPEGVTLPMTTKVGDVVLFFRTGDQIVVPMEDEDLLCIREAHCLGIFHGLPRDTGLSTADGKPLLVTH